MRTNYSYGIIKNKLTICFTAIMVVLSILTVAFTIQTHPRSNKKEEKPNVIIILTDDLGYGDVGFNGCTDIATPNIDQIAANGIVFTNGYVSYCVCAPSRAGLLTGRYQDRFGYSRNPLYKPFDENIGVPVTEQMLPAYLKQAGYNTMAIGKWHLGAHEKFRPYHRGFNEFFGFLGGGHRYFPEEYTISDQDSAKNETQSYRTKLVHNGRVTEEKEYLTEALSREAVSFVERNKQQPFFLYLAYNAPHSPLQATNKYLNRFPAINNPKRKTYAAMVSAVDDGVGLLLKKLYELKIAENTIVIFLSDNGGPEHDNASDNGVLRGGKGSLFEGGIRVPFAIQWPGKIKPGIRYELPVISLDIFATVVASIHSASKTKNQLDGQNLLPYIQHKNTSAPHQFLFWRQYDQKNYAVLHYTGMKQLIFNDTNLHQLYDIKNDVGESINIVAANPIMIDQLEQQRKQWESVTIPPFFHGLNDEKLFEKSRKGGIENKK